MLRRLLITSTLLSLLAIATVGAANVGLQTAGPMVYVTVPIDLRDIKLGSYFGKMDLGTRKYTRIGKTEFLIGIAQSGGKIYGIDADNNLVRIDPNNAETKIVGNTGVKTSPGPFGLVVNVFSSLSDGRLFLMDYDNNLFSVDPSSGRATLVGSTRIPPLKHFFLATTLAGDSNTLYFTVHEVSRANFVTVTSPTLYRIDPKTARSTRVGPTADYVFGAVYAGRRLYGFSFLDNPAERFRNQENRTTRRRTQVITLNTTATGLRQSQSFRLVGVIDEDLGGPHGILSGVEAVINPAPTNR